MHRKLRRIGVRVSSFWFLVSRCGGATVEEHGSAGDGFSRIAKRQVHGVRNETCARRRLMRSAAEHPDNFLFALRLRLRAYHSYFSPIALFGSSSFSCFIASLGSTALL